MSKRYYGGISIQNRRPVNMDSLLLKSKENNKSDIIIAAVCDGVGSTRDGAFAASLSIRMLSSWFDSISGTERLGLQLRDQVLEINRVVTGEAKRRKLETAATLSAIIIADGRYYVVHVGDSRIYSYEDGETQLLTMDHISEKGCLTAYVGRGKEIVPFYNEGSDDGKTYLLCSDGLYKRMDFEFLQDKLKSLSRYNINKAIDDLAMYAIERGENDNISLALIGIQ